MIGDEAESEDDDEVVLEGDGEEEDLVNETESDKQRKLDLKEFIAKNKEF